MDLIDEKLNCQRAKQINLVQYLFNLGYEPQKIRQHNYWYLSPFRNERTPSFKVNRKINTWYDFGEAIGGTIIDFGIRYFSCDIPKFLEILKEGKYITSMMRIAALAHAAEQEEPKITIENETGITSISLLQYLSKRAIDIKVAQQYCREITYLVNENKHAAIGFKNNSGGYELRSTSFKGSNAPKDITTLTYGYPTVAIYEGFFDYLSFISCNKKTVSEDAVILNSVAFLERAQPVLLRYEKKLLRLDNDPAGDKATTAALSVSNTYVDDRKWYKGFKDINDWLVNTS